MARKSSNALQKVSGSLVQRMAAQYGMAEADFQQVVKKTLMPKVTVKEKNQSGTWVVKETRDATDAEIMAFLVVSDQLGLNPITKEVYAFVSPTGGGIVPLVSPDGWTSLLNRQSRYGGFEMDTHLDASGALKGKTCKMKVLGDKDGDGERTISLYFPLSEWINETNVNWTKRPDWMLTLKAYRHTARLTFGFSGIAVDEEEADEISRTISGEVIEIESSRPAIPEKIPAVLSNAEASRPAAAPAAGKPAGAAPPAENGKPKTEAEKRNFIEETAKKIAAEVGITLNQVIYELSKFEKTADDGTGKKVKTGEWHGAETVAGIRAGRWLDLTYHNAKKEREKMDARPAGQSEPAGQDEPEPEALD